MVARAARGARIAARCTLTGPRSLPRSLVPALQDRHELHVRSPRFFFAEQSTELDRLIEEIHVLALHYHWSESEILRLPRSKRRRYLALLERTMASASSGGHDA